MSLDWRKAMRLEPQAVAEARRRAARFVARKAKRYDGFVILVTGLPLFWEWMNCSSIHSAEGAKGSTTADHNFRSNSFHLFHASSRAFLFSGVASGACPARMNPCAAPS